MFRMCSAVNRVVYATPVETQEWGRERGELEDMVAITEEYSKTQDVCMCCSKA